MRYPDSAARGDYGPPDFCLALSDEGRPYRLRSCWRIRELKTNSSGEYLLVRLDRPILGRNLVALKAKPGQCSVLSIEKWPLEILVFAVPDGAEKTRFVEGEDLYLLVWATLFQNRDDAQNPWLVGPGLAVSYGGARHKAL